MIKVYNCVFNKTYEIFKIHKKWKVVAIPYGGKDRINIGKYLNLHMAIKQIEFMENQKFLYTIFTKNKPLCLFSSEKAAIYHAKSLNKNVKVIKGLDNVIYKHSRNNIKDEV